MELAFTAELLNHRQTTLQLMKMRLCCGNMTLSPTSDRNCLSYFLCMLPGLIKQTACKVSSLIFNCESTFYWLMQWTKLKS